MCLYEGSTRVRRGNLPPREPETASIATPSVPETPVFSEELVARGVRQ